MCTVTFIPAGDHFFLTASRDEGRDRPVALPPEIYEVDGGKILFPKDPVSGGSWIAIHENGNGVVLLNGAWERHEHRPPYRKSRGLVALDLLGDAPPASRFEQTDYDQVAPFTVVLVSPGNLQLCRWDGNGKSCTPVDQHLPHIWSSVTLYDAAAVEKRRRWFTSWLQDCPAPSPADILRFHQAAGEGDPGIDLLMNRNDQLFTQSISLARFSADHAVFQYLDLRRKSSCDRLLPFSKPFSVNP